MDKVFAPPPQRLKLSAYVLKYPRHFALHAAGGIIYNTVVVFGSIFLGKAIDAANLVSSGGAPLSLFYRNLLAFVGFTVIFQAARYIKRFNMRVIINMMGCDIRAGLLSALFKMPMVKLSQEKVGDMMSRMIGDVEQVSASVQTTITEIWDTILLMLSYFIACMAYSPKITLLASLPIPFVVAAAQLIRHPLYKLSQKARKAASSINVHLQHNVSGISLLRLFGLEAADRQKFSHLLDEQLRWNTAYSALQEGIRPLYILFATCGIILVVGMGGELVISGAWTIGMFTAYLAMFTAMAVRTNMAGKVMNTWHGAKASWDRICEKLQNGGYDEAPEAPPARTDDPVLDVKDLSFTYPFSGEACVGGVSFAVRPGEIIGITGPVGSGKSALAAALSGLYPYGGTVLVGGVPLGQLGKTRSVKIAYMDAEQFVFSDDVRFNVTLDRPDGDIAAALALAAMDGDVNAFEDGLETRLMERGLRISGGQRQRVSLARAWYGNPEILLLDDPFSAIDVTMEQRIMGHIRASLGNRAVLLFSHRLSTFDMTDRVLVLEKGRVTQAGPHSLLVEQDGLYRDIYLAQKFIERGEQA